MPRHSPRRRTVDSSVRRHCPGAATTCQRWALGGWGRWQDDPHRRRASAAQPHRMVSTRRTVGGEDGDEAVTVTRAPFFDHSHSSTTATWSPAVATMCAKRTAATPTRPGGGWCGRSSPGWRGVDASAVHQRGDHVIEHDPVRDPAAVPPPDPPVHSREASESGERFRGGVP